MAPNYPHLVILKLYFVMLRVYFDGSWALAANRRLDERPLVERTALSLEAERTRARVGQEVTVKYTLPWKLGEDGYLKFFVTGGSLARRNGRLVLRGAKPGEVRIEAYVVEPGREPYAGRMVLIVE